MDNLRDEINELRKKLSEKELQLELLELDESNEPSAKTKKVGDDNNVMKLSNDDIERYSRQLILPRFGVSAQLKLKKISILIIGMGGLGCPAAQYLLAAGCGHIGLVDYDKVERSNFHRQTLHTEARIGLSKVQSASMALKEINPQCLIDKHDLILNSSNAMDLIALYNIVLDCSDNVATRYLLNDACVLLDKPLVSGSALQLDGQLTVYHFGETGPCYRCLFPQPPPPETVTNCGDGGVLGAVTGIIGSLQALEAIKIAIGWSDVLAGRLLIFDGERCVFRNIKLRGQRSDCAVCSPQAIIKELIDYEQFCGMPASDKNHAVKLLPPGQRITVQQYHAMQAMSHILIDVRQPAEMDICQLPLSQNVPLNKLLNNTGLESMNAELTKADANIVVVCRRGNDSQIAVEHIHKKYPLLKVCDIVGGLHAWHNEIDQNFPIY